MHCEVWSVRMNDVCEGWVVWGRERSCVWCIDRGCWQVTKGLLQKFGPDRVLDTPITEVCTRCISISPSLVWFVAGKNAGVFSVLVSAATFQLVGRFFFDDVMIDSDSVNIFWDSWYSSSWGKLDELITIYTYQVQNHFVYNPLYWTMPFGRSQLT